MLPLPGVWVPSLIKELRSHLPCGAPFKKKKKNLYIIGGIGMAGKEFKVIRLLQK